MHFCKTSSEVLEEIILKRNQIYWDHILSFWSTVQSLTSNKLLQTLKKLWRFMLLCLKTFFSFGQIWMNFFLQRGSICWRNWLRLNSHHLNNFNYREHVFSFRKAGKCLIFCLFSWVDFILCFRRNINVMDGKLVSSPLGFSCCPLFLYWAKKWCFPPQIFQHECRWYQMLCLEILDP